MRFRPLIVSYPDSLFDILDLLTRNVQSTVLLIEYSSSLNLKVQSLFVLMVPDSVAQLLDEIILVLLPKPINLLFKKLLSVPMSDRTCNRYFLI